MEHSPLLRLSPELRNQIYEFALLTTTTTTSSTNHSIQASILAKQPALTRTCRRIRQESLLLFYTLNTFRLNVPSDEAEEFSKRLLRSHFNTTDTTTTTNSGTAKVPHVHVRSIQRLVVRLHVASSHRPNNSPPATASLRPTSNNTPLANYPGFISLASALASLGFESSQIEWKAVQMRPARHPAQGGNYFTWIEERNRLRDVEEKVGRTFGEERFMRWYS